MHVIKSYAQPAPEVTKSGRIIADIFFDLLLKTRSFIKTCSFCSVVMLCYISFRLLDCYDKWICWAKIL